MPIAEGDNCEIRGILYHIEAINNSGSLDASGHKSFTTTLSLSNGVVAVSLETGKPMYYKDLFRPASRDAVAQYGDLPGNTDIQTLGTRKDRNLTGDKILKKKDKS